MVAITDPEELGRRIVADLTARRQVLGWPCRRDDHPGIARPKANPP